MDVTDLDVDYYIFSFYKTYGPHFAVMYGKYDRLLDLDSLYHYFYGRDKVPMKLEPGNTNYELAWGSAGIVDYLEALGGGGGDHGAIDRAFAGIAEHETLLGERLLSYLRDRNDVRIIGRRDSAKEPARSHYLIQGRRTRCRGRSCAPWSRTVSASGSVISTLGG